MPVLVLGSFAASVYYFTSSYSGVFSLLIKFIELLKSYPLLLLLYVSGASIVAVAVACMCLAHQLQHSSCPWFIFVVYGMFLGRSQFSGLCASLFSLPLQPVQIFWVYPGNLLLIRCGSMFLLQICFPLRFVILRWCLSFRWYQAPTFCPSITILD